MKCELAVVREQIVEVHFTVDCRSHHGVELGSLEVCSDNFIKFAVTENLNSRSEYETLLETFKIITRLFNFKQEVLRTSIAF